MLLQVSDQALSSCSPPLTVSSSSRLGSLYGHCPPGTVVFLQPEQTLVFKVDVGWRYIVVSISEICIATMYNIKISRSLVGTSKS